ncbi:1-acyl-sn-glycerol-3-phosphate acyltransferase [Methylogaea oryzae]|uniref:1-acyl-sn-glycerol-3-phosphate acyltransferase n=3 Tax=Methylogaea oryzae TaxID=1295382 RepID=A0A8D4VMQ7_9GAMM|nr:1-acyl-sn-glycerol-3-phosphate acyltransferase [Methylogaea oryzae]
MLAALFAAGVGAVSLLLPACRVLGAARQRRVRDRVTQSWCGAAARILGLRVVRQGDASVAGIMAANHISWLDVIVLGMHTPLTFVPKSEVAAWPVIGYLARQSGALFIQRGNAAATRSLTEQICWRLRRQETVVLFPEGTTSRGDRVLRFHPRLFQAALTAKAPVQPVAIAYLGPAAAKAPFVDDDEFLSHLWALLAEPEIAASVHYGNPIANAASRDQLARQARLCIAGRLHVEDEATPPAKESRQAL